MAVVRQLDGLAHKSNQGENMHNVVHSLEPLRAGVQDFVSTSKFLLQRFSNNGLLSQKLICDSQPRFVSLRRRMFVGRHLTN